MIEVDFNQSSASVYFAIRPCGALFTYDVFSAFTRLENWYMLELSKTIN